MREMHFSDQFLNKIKKLKCKNPKLANKIYQKLEIFKINPNHPGLRRHKLKGELKNSWSISINYSYRLLYKVEKNYFYFFDLGFHSEIYED